MNKVITYTPTTYLGVASESSKRTAFPSMLCGKRTGSFPLSPLIKWQLHMRSFCVDGNLSDRLQKYTLHRNHKSNCTKPHRPTGKKILKRKHHHRCSKMKYAHQLLHVYVYFWCTTHLHFIRDDAELWLRRWCIWADHGTKYIRRISVQVSFRLSVKISIRLIVTGKLAKPNTNR